MEGKAIQFETSLQDFESLCTQISKGKRGADFMVEAEDDGIDQYADTTLETEFVRLSRSLTALISENPDLLNPDIYNRFQSAIENAHIAKGSFRGRTPAYGGDWQDIDSPVKWEIENHLADFLNDNFKAEE